MAVTDDLFEAFAAQADSDNNRSQNNQNFNSNYEEIAWTGCNLNEPVIFRAVGGPPDSKLDEFTAKRINIAWVIDDSGKRFKLLRYNTKEDPNYIINKIITRVTSPRWINQEKKFPILENSETAFIYNRVKKNGLTEADKRYKFDKGWEGHEVTIMNIIDRSRMDWHRANKHTVLLAKSVTEGQNGGEFVDEGISSYAINNKLAHLFRSYGSWEKYDIAITRTGKMESPYILINASNSPKEVQPESFQKFISNADGLTDEERSWERYDLEKLYHPTSPIKLYNRLKGFISMVDSRLGTDYFDELNELAEKEKKRLEEENALKEDLAPKGNQTVVEDTPWKVEEEEPVIDKPVEGVKPAIRSRVSAPTNITLPYGDTLSDDLKSKIKNIKHNEGESFYDVEWDLSNEELASCPTCGTVSPLAATQCPACGVHF